MNQYFLIFLDILQRDYVKYPLLAVLGVLVLVFAIGGLVRDNLAMAGWEKKRFKRVNGRKVEVSDNGKYIVRDGNSVFEIDTVPSESITVATDRIKDMDEAKPDFEYDDTKEANASMVVDTPTMPKKKFDDTENAIVLENKPFVSGATITPEYRTSFTPIDLPKIFRNKNDGEKQIERVTLGATRTVIETINATDVQKEKVEQASFNQSAEPVLPVINKPVTNETESVDTAEPDQVQEQAEQSAMQSGGIIADSNNGNMADVVDDDDYAAAAQTPINSEQTVGEQTENTITVTNEADAENLSEPNTTKPLYCLECGGLLEDGAKFCGNCGARVEIERVDNEPDKVEEVLSENNEQNVSNVEENNDSAIDEVFAKIENDNLNETPIGENGEQIEQSDKQAGIVDSEAAQTTEKTEIDNSETENAQVETTDTSVSESENLGGHSKAITEEIADNAAENEPATETTEKAEQKPARDFVTLPFPETFEGRKQVVVEQETIIEKPTETPQMPASTKQKTPDYLKKIISHTPDVGEFDEAVVFGRYQIMTADDGTFKYRLFTNKNEAIYGRGEFDDLRILLSHINSFKLAIKEGKFKVIGDSDHGYRFVLRRGEAEFKGIVVPTKDKALKTVEEIKYFGLTEIIRKD